MSLPSDRATTGDPAVMARGPQNGKARRGPPPTHESLATVASAPRPRGLAGILHVLRDSWRSDLSGKYREELRGAQRDVILQRTAVLIWISVFVMPTCIWSFVYFAARPQLRHAIWIVLAAIAAVLLLRLALAHGIFRTRYHLAMLVLVGGVFGPTGSAIMALSRASGGNFLFAYFLIYFAFTALFPADAVWIVVTSAAIIASYVASTLLGLGAGHDPALVNNLIYFLELTFIGVVLNRVLCRLFFDERRARIDLRGARDALFAEMEVAQDIQTLLLPAEPTLPGYVLEGLMTPAAEVGGDYYDVIETPDGRRLVAIGDVSGHGVTTGLTMMMVRASLVGTLESRPDAPLPEIYAAMNRCLRRNLERMNLRLYMTFALLEHVGAGRFRAVGGHLPALLHRASKKTVEEIEFAGVWLGVLDAVGPELVPETSFELGKGDTLLLLTDGVVERNGASGMFGFERVHELLGATAERGPSHVIETLMARLAEHGGEQDDDVTVVALQYVGDLPAACVS